MDLFNILMLLYSSSEDIESQRLILQRLDILSALIRLESETAHIDTLIKNRPADIRTAATDVEAHFNEIIKSQPKKYNATVNNLPEEKQILVELIDQLLVLTYDYFLASQIEPELIVGLPALTTMDDLVPLF